MAFVDFKNGFLRQQQELEPVVKTALDQLLQKDLQLQKETREEPDLAAAVNKQSFPVVVLSFVTGGKTNHLTIMDQAFVTQFYSWMIADEPAAEVTDEHFEGLREALDQVFGQIKLAVADDQANYEISELELKLMKSGEELADRISNEPAMYSTYSVTVDDKQFNLFWYCWPNSGLDEETNIGTENQGSQMVEEMNPANMDPVTVQPAEFGNLSGSGSDLGNSRNVDMLLDVNLDVTVELDRKMILISELLKLGKGSIIELEKSAGEPLDILVNGRKFAEGEVVVIDDRFGIRLTQLLSPKDRIKSLG